MKNKPFISALSSFLIPFLIFFSIFALSMFGISHFFEQALAGEQKLLVNIESRFIEVDDKFMVEVGIGFSGLNTCHGQDDLQARSLGEKPSFAKSAGKDMATGMMKPSGGSSVSFGGSSKSSTGGGFGSGLRSGKDNDLKMPTISANPFKDSLSPGFPFSDGTAIQIQLQPSGPGTMFGIRINEEPVEEFKFTFADAFLVGPDCKRYEPTGRLVFEVWQETTHRWSIEYWRWRNEVLVEHWLKIGSETWSELLGTGSLPIWVGVSFDNVTTEMLGQGGWSLFTGWTLEKGNEVIFQPRVYELMPPATEVKLNDGISIVLGGLTESTKKTNLGKVPMLGDIPYIGTLFKAHEKKAELMVLVTPRVIEPIE
ncbi:MAG: type II and III secretion system protein [Desulfobacterales bacterium]|nr:type II and III secretion system protein [Desulfobacterales bacterium]